MIRFSAALVAVAIGVLVGGIATSELLLVYIAIGVSAVALLALAIGVVLKREELLGEEQGLVRAAAGAGAVPRVRAGDGQGKAASSGYVAPSPPAAGATAGYGVPFGAAGQASAPPGAGLTATRAAAARHGRSAEPVPPWETAATRESWVPGRMPAGKDQRAVSGDGVRAPSAWQDTPPVTAAGNWGVPDASAPYAGAPYAGVPNADTRAAPAPPRSWAAPPTMPVPSEPPAVKPDAGPEAATPIWFDRPGKPAGPDTPSVPSASVPTTSAPGSGSGWSWPSRDTGTPGGPVAQEEPAAPAADSGDGDDDWPARYSWLDDETDQTDESGESGKDDRSGDKGGKAVDEAEATVAANEVGPVADSESPAPAETKSEAGTKASAAPKASAPAAPASAKTRAAKPRAAKARPAKPRAAKARAAETAGQETAGQETADQEIKDAAAGEPAVGEPEPAEADGNVIAFRSRKEPGDPESGEPSPASDADQEPASDADQKAVRAGETAEAEAGRDAEAAAEPEDEPPAAATAANGTALVAVVRGVPRYHEPDCVLIRFMPEGDLQKLTVPQAKEDGCTPCAACQPTR